MPRTAHSASSLDRRITIQQPVDTPDGQGGTTRTWQTVPSCQSIPACFEDINPSKKGDEIFLAQQVQATNWVEVWIRYRPNTNITATMQVLEGVRIYNIRTVKEHYEQRLKWIVLQCEELQAQGSKH